MNAVRTGFRVILFALVVVGVADYLFARVSSADNAVRRVGLHQDPNVANPGFG